MKCKNCSANYRARELKCPYCSTTNFLGHIWLLEKTEAELEYEKAKKEYGGISRYVVYRVLSRVLVMEVLLGILLFLGVVAYFFLQEKITELSFSMNREKIEARMEKAWQEQDYEKLDEIMDKYSVDGEEYYVYTQATLMDYYYREILESRLQFMALSEEEKQENDRYYLNRLLTGAHEFITVDYGIYDELAAENQAWYEDKAEEIKACLMGLLGMTADEYQTMMETEYLYSTDLDALEQTILKRRAWQ